MIWTMTFTLDGWVATVLIWLVRISIALLLFFLGRRYARNARSVVEKLLKNPRIDISMGASIPRLAGEIVFIALWILTIATALVLLGIPATFVIGSIVVLVALIAYALRESLSNLAATVIFVFFQPFRRGETIETGGQTGVVDDMELFSTVLLTSDQRLITLPNSKIQSDGIINYTRMSTSRVAVDFLVAYDQDVEAVCKAVLEVMAMDSRILADPAAAIAVTNLGIQGIRMTASATVSSSERGNVPNDLRTAIVKRLTSIGVHFPEVFLPATE